ncbi:MAG: metalloregulator ArsR/SmtB family transcription factor [Desulfovibrio sp.]|nr:metalloregulator ArsR/SmtB family transcription factor [Desulfovibrio sp.]
MTGQNKVFEASARVFKALGHPSRLRMVDAMRDGEKCVCELRELIGCDLSTVSRHLSVLREAGVVDSEKRGTNIYYSLKLGCLADFLVCAEGAIKRNSED